MLTARRCYLKLMMIYNIISNNSYVPHSLIHFAVNSTRNKFILIPFISNNSYFHSFYPSVFRCINYNKVVVLGCNDSH